MENTKLVYATYIRTTPEKLWEAITVPEFTHQYWAGARNVSDWKVGSTWQHVFDDDPEPVAIVGKVVESTPPQRLVITWADPDSREEESLVTFDIEPVGTEGNSVCLTVTHDQLKADSRMVTGVSKGWPKVLSSMKTFLETGQGLDIFGK
jgi:uncharacterized protein YndB with AHSA1/START domain